MKTGTILIISYLLAAGSALANPQTADSCAAGLPAESKTIYDAARAEVAAGDDIRATLTTRTTSLVKAGKVARSSARSSAVAAGECLKLMGS